MLILFCFKLYKYKLKTEYPSGFNFNQKLIIFQWFQRVIIVVLGKVGIQNKSSHIYRSHITLYAALVCK